LACIGLIGKVSKALKETGGASDDYRMLLRDFQNLQVLLEQLQNWSTQDSPSQSHINAVKATALTIQVPRRKFLQHVEKYASSLGSDSRCNKRQQAPRNAQWTVTMQDEVARIRAAMTMKIVSISVLLAIHTR